MVQQKESILLSRWLAKFHRTSPQWKRVRLGIPAFPEEAKYFQVALRWADAIFLQDGHVNIVEAKLKPDFGVIGQLEGYQKLFKVTPEFSSYQHWPIKLIILTPTIDYSIIELAKDKNIFYEHFIPKGWENSF